MEEYLVSYETAVLAKEKGFNESCIYYYDKDCILESFKHCPDYDECSDGGGSVSINEILMNCDHDKLLAPTQSLLQKWLRETYNIKVFVIPNFESVNIMKDSNKIVTGYYDIYKILPYFFEAIIFVKDKNRFYSTSHETYEKALEIGLMEALNLINTK